MPHDSGFVCGPLPPEDLDHVLRHTVGTWDIVRGARLFVTGGTGFFGAWLVESFLHVNAQLDLGAEIVLLSRDPAAAMRRMPSLLGQRAVAFHEGDARHFASPPGRFDFVVHAATESSTQPHARDHQHMFDTVLDGTRRALQVARASEARGFLLVSSGAVYGRQPPDVERLTEGHEGGPDIGDAKSAYAEAKRAAELLCAIEAERSSLPTRVARCFAFVGPGLPLSAHFAIGNFIGDALQGGPIRVRGDGTAVRSYLYMADLAIWLWTLLLMPDISGAYNVGSERAISILDTARTVARVCTSGVPIEVGELATSGSVPDRYVPSTERARRDLSLEQHINLDDAIGRTAQWHRSAHSS